MADLRDSPYSLEYGEEVVVRITATNSLGDGTVSSISTGGALMETPPV